MPDDTGVDETTGKYEDSIKRVHALDDSYS
jgi:hypothetical protein